MRIVAANQTGTDTRLELRGPRSASSGPIPANSPGTLQADLPTGTYVIAAAGIPGARIGKLVVGPYRASSENDVLLPVATEGRERFARALSDQSEPASALADVERIWAPRFRRSPGSPSVCSCL